MERLVVDVGNTETALGVVSGADGAVRATWRLSSVTPRTRDEFRLLLGGLLDRDGVDPAALGPAVVGSVVPGITQPLAEALGALIPRGVRTLTSARGLPITLDVEEPQTVGVDRFINTLAASRLYGRDTIVVDLGTATTYDCITREGVFLGGVIAPGIRAGEDWLAQRAAKLPRVEFRPPERVIGRRTEACLHSGVFFSVVDAVDGIVDRIRAEWEGADPLVVATGGYSELLTPYSRTVDRSEPHITLLGLAMAGDVLDGLP